MWNNKKRSRASPTRRGVGAEVCSVNKMRPLMYERADFSRWENDTHRIFHCITVCNILCLCRNIIQTAFQTQTSQICSEDLASVRLLFLPKKTKVRLRTPPKCSHTIVAVTSLFIHFYSLHMQRLDCFMMRLIRWSRTASFVWIRQCFIHAGEDYLRSCLYCVADWLTGPLALCILWRFFSYYLRCWV